MSKSILTSTKKMLGIAEEIEDFDLDIITCINSVFDILEQMSRDAKGFTITDKSATWDDYFADQQISEMIKSYVYMKVRLMFDPPQSSFVLESLNKQISELEFRINVKYDSRSHEDIQ